MGRRSYRLSTLGKLCSLILGFVVLGSIVRMFGWPDSLDGLLGNLILVGLAGVVMTSSQLWAEVRQRRRLRRLVRR